MSNPVLDGLAQNPALPPSLARRLLATREGRSGVADRPDLTPELIEEIIATADHGALHSLALNPHVPDPFRARLATCPNGGVRAALVIGTGRAARAEQEQASSGIGTGRAARSEQEQASSGSRPEDQNRFGPAASVPWRSGCEPDRWRDLFERLVTDPDKRVREYLAQGEHVPADLRARLAGDPGPEIRATLAQWWVTAPEPVRRRLLTDPEEKVRAAACSTYYSREPHPVPPPDLLPALIDDPVTRAGAVPHLTLTPALVDRLAGDADYAVRRELARRPRLPTTVRDRLGRDPSAAVRVAVFARPDTPEALRAEIAREIPRLVAAALDQADDPGLDDHDFLRLFEDSAADQELRELRPPWVTADPLPHVASPHRCFRIAAAAGAAALPPEAVARLIADEDPAVAAEVVRQVPHLVSEADAERAERAHRPSLKAFRQSTGYPFGPETLIRFAGDPDPRLRRLAAGADGLPGAVLAELAADSDIGVRMKAAAHPRAPLTALLGDPIDDVVRAAAANPALPVGEMEKALSSMR